MKVKEAENENQPQETLKAKKIVMLTPKQKEAFNKRRTPILLQSFPST